MARIKRESKKTVMFPLKKMAKKKEPAVARKKKTPTKASKTSQPKKKGLKKNRKEEEEEEEVRGEVLGVESDEEIIDEEELQKIKEEILKGKFPVFTFPYEWVSFMFIIYFRFVICYILHFIIFCVFQILMLVCFNY